MFSRKEQPVAPVRASQGSSGAIATAAMDNKSTNTNTAIIAASINNTNSITTGSHSRAWYSDIISARNGLLFLLGLGIAGGIVVITRSRRKKVTQEELDAIIKYIQLLPPPQPAPPVAPHPLTGLTFVISDIFDVESFITGFGSPQWESTHEPATRTSSSVALLVQSGATCIGKTLIDEMGYSITGRNKYYGTLSNPVAVSRLPGGSSCGSAVAVASNRVDFALGIDTCGGVRIPAAYCGILGFRPSHGAVSCIGVVPVSQSLDTVGLLARDPSVLQKVGQILLKKSNGESKPPKRILVAEDCFNLLSSSESRDLSIAISAAEKAFGKQSFSRVKLGEYFASKIPSLKMSLVCFRIDGEKGKAERGASALKALREALYVLKGHEFKLNHEDWIQSHEVSQHLKSALETNPELVSQALKLRNETRLAMNELLMNEAVLLIPTAPGLPPKLNTKESVLTDFEAEAYTLLSVASMSGCCQVTIPMGKFDGCPAAISIIGKHGSDSLLLDATKIVFPVLQKEAEAYSSRKPEYVKVEPRPDDAEAAKEKGNEAFKRKDYKAAIENYSEAIRCDEENPTYYNNRAAAYLAMRNFHKAEIDCCKAIELDKKNVKAFLRRATARESLGYYKEAGEDFKFALVLEPTNKTASEGIKRLKKLILG